MSNAAIAQSAATKLGSVCHVVEEKGPWVLVHASPTSLAAILALGFSIHPSKKGGDYYALKAANTESANDTAPVRHLSVAPPPAAPVTQVRTVAPAPVAPQNGRLEIKGQDYAVKETRTKRSMDCRRFEVRKLGDEIAKPYVVSFQSDCGSEAQCSCPDWIYRRRQCKHITAIQAAFTQKTLAGVA